MLCANQTNLRGSVRFPTHKQGLQHRIATRSRSNLIVKAQSKQYDYIIVGGGASGCVIANRLSADTSKSVLLLEAGPDPTNDLIVKVPAALTRLFKSHLDWNLYSEIAKNLNREIYLARGKMLGGSTCSNALLYMRGTKQDYDDWNLPNWTGQDVLKWFKHSENNAQFENEYHNKGGEFSVESPRYHNRLQDVFFQACKELNVSRNEDFNDWSRPQTGYGNFQLSTNNGERGHTYRQYIQSISEERANLQIRSGAYATKLLIEQSGQKKTTQGIEYTLQENYGPRLTAGLSNSGEVIVAGGAIHAPHLLMNSGLGPQKVLDHYGIPTIQNLPGVGQNLQDQPGCLSSYQLTEESGPSVLGELLGNKGGIKNSAIFNYLLRRRGPLASVGCERGAFLDFNNTGRPNVQLRFVPGYSLSNDGVQAYYFIGKTKEREEKIPTGITIQSISCKAKSLGTVSLKSNSPLDKPNINIGYLNNSSDQTDIVQGLKFSRELMQAPAFKDINVRENFPGPNVQSDSDWSEYVKQSIHSSNALVGTCKMGTQEDPNSVVTPDLKVKGVDNLRVACSSVIPIIPAGQTGAPTIMIAEKAASIIKEQAKGKSSGATERVPQLAGV